MSQSKAEAEFLMEQQHGFNTSQGNFHEDDEDDEEFLEDCPVCFTVGQSTEIVADRNW
jgi:hypothetical protein